MKEKYVLNIADIQMTIVSEEAENHIRTLEAELDKRIRDISVHTTKCTKLDAALLCSLDYLSEKLKADRRVKNLEAQVLLLEENLKRAKRSHENSSTSKPDPEAKITIS